MTAKVFTVWYKYYKQDYCWQCSSFCLNQPYLCCCQAYGSHGLEFCFSFSLCQHISKNIHRLSCTRRLCYLNLWCSFVVQVSAQFLPNQMLPCFCISTLCRYCYCCCWCWWCISYSSICFHFVMYEWLFVPIIVHSLERHLYLYMLCCVSLCCAIV